MHSFFDIKPCADEGHSSRHHVFFDYDGTLCYKDSEMPKSAVEALRLLRERGHFVALATGRLQANAIELMRSLGIDSMIADGGNSATLGGKLLWMESMPLNPCKNFLHWLDAHGFCWAVTTKNELKCYTPHREYESVFSDYYIKSSYVPDLDIDSLQTIYKIYVPCAPGVEDGFEFGGVTWVRYNPRAIYCEPTEKANGIKRLMGVLGAPLDSVVVFGDGANDLSMFTDDWTSVAMGNAIPQLKERASLVTDNLEDDGVYKACKRLGLI